jgi:hypothetical protein
VTSVLRRNRAPVEARDCFFLRGTISPSRQGVYGRVNEVLGAWNRMGGLPQRQLVEIPDCVPGRGFLGFLLYHAASLVACR